jgi:plasmid stabilization system protein ParE
MTRLEWTDPAISDLEHIHDYVVRDSPQYAIALVERLITSAERIKSFPASGRRVLSMVLEI